MRGRQAHGRTGLCLHSPWAAAAQRECDCQDQGPSPLVGGCGRPHWAPASFPFVPIPSYCPLPLPCCTPAPKESAGMPRAFLCEPTPGRLHYWSRCQVTIGLGATALLRNPAAPFCPLGGCWEADDPDHTQPHCPHTPRPCPRRVNTPHSPAGLGEHGPRSGSPPLHHTHAQVCSQALHYKAGFVTLYVGLRSLTAEGHGHKTCATSGLASPGMGWGSLLPVAGSP